MDASTIIVGLLFLCSGVSTQTTQDEQNTTVSGVSTQSPQDDQKTTVSSVSIQSSQDKQETTTEFNTFGLNCTTPKDLQGNCMTRKDCDWSTNAIDLSLYKPKWYKKTCSANELCCPYIYQIQPKEPNDDDLELQDVK